MNKKEAVERFCNVAKSQVGVKEVGGNNCGTQIREFQTASWLKPGPWAWCAAFCCWTLKKWGDNKDVLEYMKMDVKQFESWRCKDASAFGWEKWARDKGLLVLPETKLAKAGDLVIFDFSHIGVVIKDQISIEAGIETVEGNTNGKGERDSVSGDGVWNKKRATSLTKCYVRILS